MNATRRRGGSLLLFLLIPGLGALAPLLVYPAITSEYGATGFAAVAIAQSVGATAAIICELGWSVVGPQEVARSSPEQISSTHRASVASKAMALAVGAPAAAMAALAVASDHEVAAAILAASMSLTALSPVWILIGLNRPGLIIVVDVVPRVLLNLAAALSILLGAPLAILALVNLLSVPFALAVAGHTARFSSWPRFADFRIGMNLARGHLPLTAGRSVSVVYTTALTAIIGALSPGAVAVYAATDRLFRMGLLVLAGVPARLQSWLGAAQGAELRRRSVQALWANLALGLCAAAVFFAIADPAAQVLFGGVVTIPSSTAALGSAVVAAICTSRGLGLALVAGRMPNTIAFANVSAAGAGLLVAIAAVPTLGANGGLLAALTAETVGIAVQAAFVRQAIR